MENSQMNPDLRARVDIIRSTRASKKAARDRWNAFSAGYRAGEQASHKILDQLPPFVLRDLQQRMAVGVAEAVSQALAAACVTARADDLDNFVELVAVMPKQELHMVITKRELAQLGDPDADHHQPRQHPRDLLPRQAG